MSAAADRKSRRSNLWKLYAGRCFWCGTKMIAETKRFDKPEARYFTIDELIPRSRGGTLRLENQVPAHRICNERRGNMVAPKAAIERHLDVIRRAQCGSTSA